ncbi:hypothetical protein [Nocardia sp. NPDC049526]|uniref:hypothetical protein n=1 Tax=Nocardia sp. NPDC049526 TaxID=3364316 RepID=UPI0037B3157A
MITGVLDGVADESGNDAGGGDDAIVYQTVSERQAIVSQPATRKWASSSQVSDRSALAALAREEHGLELFETVRVLEIVYGQTLFVLVGPARDTVSAAGARAY